MVQFDTDIHILHIDDSADFAELTATFLEETNERFAVDTSTTAKNGLDRLTDADYDCIVSDYDMPGQNGIEFLEDVREIDPDIPFILFTGKGSEEVASEAISAGVTDYLQKESGTHHYPILANRIQNAVESARAARERQRHLDAIETAQEGISILTEDGRFQYVNEAYADIYGYDPEEMVGEHWELIYRDQDVGRIRDTILPEVKETGHWHGVTTGLRADGTTFEEDHNLAITGQGELVCTVRDVSERREQAKRLRSVTNRFETIFEESNDPIFILDVDNDDIVDANQQAAELLEYSREELISSVSISDIHPADMEQYHAFLDQARDGSSGGREEFQCVTKNGDLKQCDVSVAPADIDAEDYVIAIIRDVTERSRREQMIEELHSTAQALSMAKTEGEIAELAVNSLDDILDMPVSAIWLYDKDDTVLRPVDWTDQCEEVIGSIPTFEPGSSIAWEAFDSGEVRYFDNVSTAPGVFNEETPIRSEILLPVGKHGLIIVGSTRIGDFDTTDGSLSRIVATHVETALDRLNQETQLRKERETVERLFETSPVAITIVGVDGKIQRANEHAEEVLGLSRSALTDRTYDDPEWGIIDDDGEAIPSEDLPFRRVLDTCEPIYDYEHGIELPDGTRRWLSINAAPLTDEDGAVEGVIAVTKDITERREQEQEITRQNERLNEFAGIVTHDLRSPLSVAEGRIQLAQDECESEHLAPAAEAIARSQELIEDILVIARDGKAVMELEWVNLKDIVDGCWANVDTGDATLVNETDKTIQADARRLRQLLENLIRNAIDHGGSDVTVSVKEIPGGFAIEDDGPGIPPDQRDTVFDAGYSTLEEGTGFGLSIVKEAVGAHGWNVCATDGTKGGARFEVTGVEFAAE